MPPRWTEFLGIDATSSAMKHPYLRVVRRLHRMELAPRDMRDGSKLGRYLVFIEGVNQCLLERLKDLGPRSLILFAHWLALLCTCDLWWCKERAMTACWLIYHHFDTALPEMRSWLVEPANASGYASKALRSASKATPVPAVKFCVWQKLSHKNLASLSSCSNRCLQTIHLITLAVIFLT